MPRAPGGGRSWPRGISVTSKPSMAGRARVLRTSGSIYHKAEWVVTLPGEGIVRVGARLLAVRGQRRDRSARVHARSQAARRWDARRGRRLARRGVRPKWRGLEGTRGRSSRSTTEPGRPASRTWQFLDEDGRDVVQVRHGDPLSVQVHVRVEPSLADRRMTFVIVFVRQGSPYSACIYESRCSGDRRE